MTLTDAKVKNAKVPTDKKQVKLSDGGGLYLFVKKSGKYWRLDYRFAEKRKTFSIGVYPTVTLKQARAIRTASKEQLAQGIEPNKQANVKL